MSLFSSLPKKIFIGIVLTCLIPLLILSFQNHYLDKQAFEKLEKGYLSYALKSRMLWLREWLRHSKKEFNRIASKISIKNGVLSPEDTTLSYCIAETLFNGHSSYKSLTIYNHNWEAISQYPKNHQNTSVPAEEFKKKFSTNTLLVTAQPRNNPGDAFTILPIGQSIINRNGTVTGFIVAELNISNSLKRILGDTSDLNEKGSLYLFTSDGKALFNSSSPLMENSSLAALKLTPHLLGKPYWDLKNRINNKGIPVFFITVEIPEINWILMIEIEKVQILKEFQRNTFLGGAATLLILFFVIFIAYRIARQVSTPLEELALMSRHITRGNFQERLPEFKDDHLKEVSRSFNSMLDTLEKNQQDVIQSISLSSVGKISSSIVHEMRNPLSSIQINLQALARKVEDDQDYSEMATIALMQVRRLESMFSDLLNFSKPIDLTPEAITFKQLANDVLEILTRKAANKNISINVVDNLDNTLIKVDKQHSMLALLNLIDNAIQWSPTESTINVTADTLQNNEGFFIDVEDSGSGLREDQMTKLFQPFYTTRKKGTGLGLANVKKIVEFHGGTVTATNSSMGGSKFSMIFKGRLLK